MNSSELETFIVKFRHLWKAGLDAHLDIESHAGQAWVGLRVRLGPEPGPAQQHPPFPPHVDKKTRDGPSRQRRRARRAAARTELADPVEQTRQDEPVVEAEDAHRKAAENVVLDIEESIVEANKSTEKVDASHDSEEKDTEKQADAIVNNLEEINDELCLDSAYLAEHADIKVAVTFMSDYG